MSNYKRLGDFIQQVDVRNIEDKKDNLLGVSTQKVFIPSVANTIGTNFKKYKIVKKYQFTYVPDTSRRGDKIGIAMLEDFEEALVSQAYTVFEIKDSEKLLPKYLMIWFSREEFDRYARYKSHGSVREIFSWEEMCEVQIPIPSLPKQKEIIKEYETITNRIKLNEQLTQKLESTAQTIYKEWFVNFEFPNKEGKPYKSSGGKMVYNDELDMEVPEGWKVNELRYFCKIQNGYAFKSDDFSTQGIVPILKIKNISPPIVNTKECQYYTNNKIEDLEKYAIKYNDILISMTGSGANQMNSAVGQVGRYISKEKSLLNQRVGKIILEKNIYNIYVYFFISNKNTHLDLLASSTGSANQANISSKQIEALKILIPDIGIIKKFEINTKKMLELHDVKHNENIELLKIKNILLSKVVITGK